MLTKIGKWLLKSPDANYSLTDKDNFKRLQFYTFVSATLGYAIYYVCRLGLNVMKKNIIDSGVMTAQELGLVGSALFFAYAIGKFVNGFLADYVNVRRVFALGLLVSALVNLLLGFSTQFWIFFVLWGINGWAQSVGAPSSVVSLSQWYPSAERGRYYGFWSTSHNIGEALTYIITAWIVSLLGWYWGFRVAAAVGFLGVILIFHAFRERPSVYGYAGHMETQIATVEGNEKSDFQSTLALQKKVIMSPWVWILALASAFFYVTRYAINSWGVYFLEESFHYSPIQASSIIALNATAGIFGTILSGVVSEKLFKGNHFIPTILFLLIYIISTALFVYSGGKYYVLIISMVLFGLSLGALLVFLGGLIAVDICGKNAAGAAMGVVGISSYLGAGVQDILSGYLITKSSSLSSLTIKVTKTTDFTAAGYFWIGSGVVALMLTIMVGFKLQHLKLKR